MSYVYAPLARPQAGPYGHPFVAPAWPGLADYTLTWPTLHGPATLHSDDSPWWAGALTLVVLAVGSAAAAVLAGRPRPRRRRTGRRHVGRR